MCVYALHNIGLPTYQDFDEACFFLKKCRALRINQQEVAESEAGPQVLSFLQALLQPFMDSYQVMLRFLSEEGANVITEKQFLPAVRNLASKLILSGNTQLASDLLDRLTFSP